MSRADDYLRQLQLFKDEEKPEAVLLIADSPMLIKLVVAWMNMTVSRSRRPTISSSASKEDVWKWLWENARFSREELIRRVPASDAKTESKIDALIANRVLYPDGTVNGYVEKYLRERVLSCFSRRPTRKQGD